MADYTELIKALRHCDSRKSCKECPFYGEDVRSEKCQTMIPDAADAIEQLQKRIIHLEFKIYTALDALDRGADNDWARKALEEATAPPKEET